MPPPAAASATRSSASSASCHHHTVEVQTLDPGNETRRGGKGGGGGGGVSPHLAGEGGVLLVEQRAHLQLVVRIVQQPDRLQHHPQRREVQHRRVPAVRRDRLAQRHDLNVGPLRLLRIAEDRALLGALAGNVHLVAGELAGEEVDVVRRDRRRRLAAHLLP